MKFPKTLLYKDPVSGGELYQGNRFDVCEIENTYYDLVILAAYDFQPEILTPEQAEVELSLPYDYMDDILDCPGKVITKCPPRQILRVPLTEPSEEEAELIGRSHRPYAFAAAGQAIASIKRGKFVLSSCWGGVNRSSFISASILWHLGQGKMDDIIDRLVDERCFSCPGLMTILRQAEEFWIEQKEYLRRKKECGN